MAQTTFVKGISLPRSRYELPRSQDAAELSDGADVAFSDREWEFT
jgi:hypothetical protein